jgi:MFS superfamily sulfate permease-like transporter
MTARDHASHVLRSPKCRAVLDRDGARVRILKLQGFIFFGTAANLLETVHAGLSDERTRFDCLLLDFTHVSRLDSSAVQAFSKLKRLADRKAFAAAIAPPSSSLPTENPNARSAFFNAARSWQFRRSRGSGLGSRC